MRINNKALVLAGALVAFAAGGAQAQSFATLGKAPAKPMTAEQKKAVQAKVHIFRLVEFRGVDLPAQAEAATRAAAPTPNGGDFTRSPSREATAFDFLNPPT